MLSVILNNPLAADLYNLSLKKDQANTMDLLDAFRLAMKFIK